MPEFSQPHTSREQLTLFAERLDDAIAPDHRVRVLDEIFSQLDWSSWEAKYKRQTGRPPFPPRLLASVIVYGILNSIRTSRLLEEALEVRLDFRWLAHGQTIDHSTICNFRRSHSEELKELFVQIVLLARSLGFVSLRSLGYDGSRIRANNRRQGTRTPEKLRELKQRLAEEFERLEAQTAEADSDDQQNLGERAAHKVRKDLADLNRRRSQIDAALAELKQIEQQGRDVPKRHPITDPESRVSPNKDGGFAPNYTPTVMVDIDSGIIVGQDVLSEANENRQMLPIIDQVAKDLNEAAPVEEVLADGLMATGENIQGCSDRGIDFHSPLDVPSEEGNPAIREDLSQPVPEEQWDKLPTRSVKRRTGTCKVLSKDAFVYDKESDCYYCPMGRRLEHVGQCTEREHGLPVIRERYQSQNCEGCPLQPRCTSKSEQRRAIRRNQHASCRETHAKKMQTEAAKKIYSRRSHPTERPFAVIKQQFRVRQFLHRGRQRVRQEWTWLTLSFNLLRLMSLRARGHDPPATC